MPFIDERGRVFGRVNLVDAAVGLLVLALIPLAYVGYALFRQPEARIVSLDPPRQTPVAQVRIVGQNLRPYLRVSFNQYQGINFGFISPTEAEVRLPEMPPGTYDVILYDVARELNRLPHAFTVGGPSKQAMVLLAGDALGLDDAAVSNLKPGTRLANGESHLEVVQVEAPRADTRVLLQGTSTFEPQMTNGKQLPLLLRGTCSIADRRCQIGGIDIEPGFMLSLATEAGAPIAFRMDEALADGPSTVVDALARFVTPTEIAGLVRAGNRERSNPAMAEYAATLTGVRSVRRVPAGVQVPIIQAGGYASTVQDDVALIDAEIKMRVQPVSTGLQHRGHPVKVGAPFVFETDAYVLHGWLLQVK